MHDIDRVQMEAGEFETGLGQFGESEQGGAELPMHETQELELASRLLEVSDEQELEQFLGDVFHAVGAAAGRFARSETGKALGAVLKDAIGKALPLVRGAVGGAIGPAVGAAPRGDLAQQAGSLLGLELEGLSPPDQEFETARQLVRLAGSAYRHAAWAPLNMPPRSAARLAAARAGRRYAPGLLRWAATGGLAIGRAARRAIATAIPLATALPLAMAPPALPLAMAPPVVHTLRPRQGTCAASVRGGRNRPTRRPAYASSYGVPPDPAAADEPGGYGPNGYDVPTAVIESPALGGPPVVLEPVAVGEPSAAAPPAAVGEPSAAASPVTAAAEPASAGELGGAFAASSGWPSSAGSGYPGARSGRWERRGQVLIVHGV